MVWKGNGLFDSDQYETAIEAYSKALNLRPENGDAYIKRGRAYDYDRVGRNQEAKRYFAQAIITGSDK